MGAVAEPYGGGGIMKDPQIDRAKTLRVRRGIVLFGSGALALAAGVTGGYAALAGGSSSLRMRQDPTVPFTSASPLVRATATHTVSPSVTPARSSPTAEPTSDPTALADGVYPTFVRADYVGISPFPGARRHGLLTAADAVVYTGGPRDARHSSPQQPNPAENSHSVGRRSVGCLL